MAVVDAPDRAATEQAPCGPRSRRALARVAPFAVPLALYAASRLIVLAGAAVTATAYGRGLSTLRVFTLWDAGWFVRVARNGYPTTLTDADGVVQGELAFFPLFPMAIWAVDFVLPVAARTAGVVASTFFGATAAVLFWVLVDRLADRPTANRATALFVFFPGAHIFSFGYSESMMLTFTIASLLALLDRRWVLAGTAAALATTTRASAVVLVLCAGWAAAMALRRTREWKALAAPVLAPLGMVGFFLYLWRRTGDLDIWFDAQRRGWGQELDPLNNVRIWRATLLHPTEASSHDVLLTLGLAFTVVAVVLLRRAKLPTVLLIWTWGTLAMLVLSSGLNLRPRFVLTAFPLIIAVALAARDWVHSAVLGAFAGGAVVLTVYYAVSGAAP